VFKTDLSLERDAFDRAGRVHLEEKNKERREVKKITRVAEHVEHGGNGGGSAAAASRVCERELE